MENSSIKISIIMPVYNVEKFLPKAVESILTQKFNDFELFLVDDGSRDSSGKICDEYANNDNRVKVIHQENLGAHTARNNALKYVSGKYVCFFDSDDYIDINMLYDLYNIAEKYDCNLVVSGFYINTYYDDNNFIKLNYIPWTSNNSDFEFFENKSEFRKFAYKNFDRNMFYPPWNKLYNLEYIKNNNILFPITYRDDFPFVVSVIKNIDKVAYTKRQYYNFLRKRTDSETQKYVSNLYDKREEEHNLMIELYKYWDMVDDINSFEMIARRYIDRLIECMTNLFNSECKLTKKEKKEKIKKYLLNENFKKCILFAKPNKLYLRIMYLPLKLKNIDLCYTMASFINKVKKQNIKLFSILKTNR